MNENRDVRWKQRFQNFEKAYLLFEEALLDRPLKDYSKLEQEGIIQRFEYTFELAWKTIKDKLFYEGYDEKTPRSVIRRAFEVNMMSEEETEMDDGLKDKHRDALKSLLFSESKVKRVILFGSRAMGNFKPTSDVDLCLRGEALKLEDLVRLSAKIDDLPMAQRVDLVLYHTLESEELLKHIREFGVEWEPSHES